MKIINMNIFVYGTLLQGLQRARALSHSQFIGRGWIEGKLYDLGNFSGLTEGNGRVLGELYAVDQLTLDYLNRIEGYDSNDLENSLYLRKEITVCLSATNDTVVAESYFYNRPIEGKKLITHGDYRTYLAEQGIPEWY